MTEQLSKLGFKKDLNTSIWIHEKQTNFSYSDGDEIENYLLESIRSCHDRSTSSGELRQFIKDWATLYHLSRRRSNILRPFSSYLKEKKVLEIGCGCGALTRYLGEIGADVVSIEGSPRRALIARERCKELSNVEIVVATSELVADLIEFDVVILNGVLEYSTKYMGINGPSILLNTSFKQLKDSGILILAIENQLGLKYFSGQPEDHAGQPMYGINNSYREGEFKTWGRKELIGILENSGFKNIEQFIPLPDYKLPVSIITPLGFEKFPNELSPLAIDSVLEDPQRTPYDLFSLERAYQTTWKNGLASDLANSFLMIAGKTTLASIVPENIVAFQFKDDKENGLNQGLEIYQENLGLKLKSFSLDSINTVNNEYSLPKEFLTHNSYWLELLEIMNRPRWTLEEVISWTKFWVDSLLMFVDPSVKSNWSLGVNAKFWEFTPLNAYRADNGKLQFLEQEQISSKEVSFNLIVYHGIKVSLQKIVSASKFTDNRELSYLEVLDAIFENIKLLKTKEFTHLFFEEEEQKMNRLLSNVFQSSKGESSYTLQQRETIVDLKFRVLELQSQVFNLENNLNLICQSQSWRYTEPLRKILKFLKRSR